MLVSFEGGEGAGKTTLIQTIYKECLNRGYRTLLTRAPGGTKLGEMIRSLLLHRTEYCLKDRAELFLFLADRAQHVAEVIKPALQKGMLVLCDRFNDSTVAYQGGARGFDPLWIRKLCHFVTEGLEPTLTLYLDIDPEEGLKRVQRSKDRIEQEAISFHQRIRSAYLKIAQEEPKRFYVINASESPDSVYGQALSILESHW